MDRRIVVEYTAGPLAGIREIAGRASELAGGSALPAHITNIGSRGRTFDIRLTRVEKSYALYTEMAPQPTGGDEV